MDINEIQTRIGELFSKYNIPAITLNMPTENLHRWSSQVAAHFKLNVENFSQVMSELFWSAAHIQLSLGYALIARQDCKFPKGIKGKAFKEEDMPNARVKSSVDLSMQTRKVKRRFDLQILPHMKIIFLT